MASLIVEVRVDLELNILDPNFHFLDIKTGDWVEIELALTTCF